MEGKIISAGGHFGVQKAFHQGTPDGTLFLYVLSKILSKQSIFVRMVQTGHEECGIVPCG